MTFNAPKEPTDANTPVKAHISTMGDAARLAGVHIDYVALAHSACIQRDVVCHETLDGLDFISCQIVLAREWCKVNDCSEPFTSNIRADPCKTEVRSRACSDLDRPIQCRDVQAAGLVLIPSAWPEGPVTDPMPLAQ